MKQKIQNFKAKLKENRKFKVQFVSAITACVVVIACAITVPVCMHNSNVKKALAAETENTTNNAVSAEADTSTETTTETTTAETTTAETTTIEVTEPASSGSSANNGSSTNNGSSSSNKGGSSGSGNSSSSKPTTTKPVTTTKKETTTEDDRWNWTQADVDAAVAEAKRYARSKGYTVYEDSKETVTIDGVSYATSWTALDTRYDSKKVVEEDLKYEIDMVGAYGGSLAFLHGDEGIGVNVFSKNCGDYWEIYVVC